MDLRPLAADCMPLAGVTHYCDVLGLDGAARQRHHELVTICGALGQALIGPAADVVAWIRCGAAALGPLARDDFEQFCALDLQAVSVGPVLYLVAAGAVTPGWLFATVRELARAPGVRLLAGYSDRRAALRVRAVRHERGH